MTTKSFINRTRWLSLAICTLIVLFTFSIGNAWGAEETASFDFTSDAVLSALGITKPSSGNGTNLSNSKNYTIGSVTMTTVHGSTNTRVWNSSGTLTLRVYGSSGSLTFSVPSGYKINSISFASKSGLTASPAGSWSSNKWTAPSNTTSATFTKTTSGSNNNGVITVKYEATASKTLSSIAITTAPTTTKYLDGETFSKSGAVVTATYSDASTANVSTSATWNKTTLSTSDTQVQASYTEGGVTRTANQSINVYSVTVQVKDEDGNTLSGAGMPTASASGRTLTASASGNNYVFKRWVAVTAAGTSIASTSSASTSLTGTPTGAVTVKAEYYKPITITYKANNTTFTTQTYGYGGTLAFPASDPDGDDYSCTGKTFVGWVAEANKDYSHASTPPTYATAGGSVTAAATYYAVFADASAGAGGYEYIGDAGVLEAGETYIFVSSKSTGSAYALKSSNLPNNNTSGVKGSAVSVTIASGPKITTVNTDLEFYCDSHDEEGLDELYIGETSNTLRINGNGIGYGDARAFYDNTGLYGWNNAGSTFYDVYYNSTSTKFEASSSASGRVYAFKKSSITYTNFATTCCTQLGSINGSFTWLKQMQSTKPALIQHLSCILPHLIIYYVYYPVI